MTQEELIELARKDVLIKKEEFFALYDMVRELEEKISVQYFINSGATEYETVIDEGKYKKFIINYSGKAYVETREEIKKVNKSLISAIAYLVKLNYPGYIETKDINWDKNNSTLVKLLCGKEKMLNKDETINLEHELIYLTLQNIGINNEEIDIIYDYHSNMDKKKIFTK